MRLPSRWKGKVGHTGDLGECRGGTAGGALGSDYMVGSVGSSVLGSGGWAAGERMPRRVGLLLVTWGAKGAGSYRVFCEASGTIFCQELSLSSQPFVGAGSMLPAFSVGQQSPALGVASGSLSQLGTSPGMFQKINPKGRTWFVQPFYCQNNPIYLRSH